ncbi:ThiF family adenylyltransferase [Burkholderia sp. 22PA0099]|uniref:ThiF family adenylyltransferase n=1 Tax=Burkholderia sp. 22PA0099 TaxID=3237372 RepID=UPI0039C3FB4E
MNFDESTLRAEFPELILESRRADGSGITFKLHVPAMPPGRSFESAEVWLPNGFPEWSKARIRLSSDAILRIPHVENGGLLCIGGDPGPGVGWQALDRLRALLFAYREDFLARWQSGDLDGDFLKEAQNYWGLNVTRSRSKDDPVLSVWTVALPEKREDVLEGVLLLPGRIVVVAGIGTNVVRRLVDSLGPRATQQIRVLVADISVSYGLVPSTWPNDEASLNRLLQVRLTQHQQDSFFSPIRRRQPRVHRIALFRSPQGNFAYLLPGGPPTVVQEGKRARARPSRLTSLPLEVERFDPSWTVGRDQHSEVASRQRKHVLVLGAGALGSPVIEHLAKAGIGRVTVIDNDSFESANVGRHLLGVDAIDHKKSEAVAQRVMCSHPSCSVYPVTVSAETWLRANTLEKFDLVIDLTGEPDVRWAVDKSRRAQSRPLLIGWMEPFVAAAHACLLPANVYWIDDIDKPNDKLTELEAVKWPAEVIRQEPGCSSRFQAYTAAQAAYAVALVSEHAIDLVDGKVQEPQIYSWLRGQEFLDAHGHGLEFKPWAASAAPHDGLIIKRRFQ